MFCFDSLLCIDIDKCDSKNLQSKSIEVLLLTNIEVCVYINYKLIVFYSKVPNKWAPLLIFFEKKSDPPLLLGPPAY